MSCHLDYSRYWSKGATSRLNVRCIKSRKKTINNIIIVETHSINRFNSIRKSKYFQTRLNFLRDISNKVNQVYY